MTAVRRISDIQRLYGALGYGELVAAAALVLATDMWLIPSLDDPHAARGLWFGLIPLVIVLVQAGFYWVLARHWAGRGWMPYSLAVIYRVFQALDIVIFTAGLAGIFVTWTGGPAAAGAVLAWVAGVVAYLNYFVVRLAFPAKDELRSVRRPQSPRLVRDIRQATRHQFNRRI